MKTSGRRTSLAFEVAVDYEHVKERWYWQTHRAVATKHLDSIAVMTRTAYAPLRVSIENTLRAALHRARIRST